MRQECIYYMYIRRDVNFLTSKVSNIKLVALESSHHAFDSDKKA